MTNFELRHCFGKFKYFTRNAAKRAAKAMRRSGTETILWRLILPWMWSKGVWWMGCTGSNTKLAMYKVSFSKDYDDD